MDKLKP